MTYEAIYDINIDDVANPDIHASIERSCEKKLQELKEVLADPKIQNLFYESVINDKALSITEGGCLSESVDELDASSVLAILGYICSGDADISSIKAFQNGLIEELLGQLETIDYENRDLPKWMEVAAEKAVRDLEKLPNEAETTTYRAMSPYFPNDINDKNVNEFDVDDALRRAAKRNGLYLDSYQYEDAEIGLPCNIPFCVRRVAKQSKEPVEVFKFGIGGYFSGSFSFTLRQFKDGHDALIRVRLSGFDRRRIVVKVDEVELLYRCLRDIDFICWKERYWAPVLDGVQWRTSAYIGTKPYKSSGSNSYPEGFDRLIDCLIDVFGCDELEQYRGCCGEGEVAE